MKKLIILLVVVALLAGVVSVAIAATQGDQMAGSAQLAYMKKAHGTHGLGNVNQYFNGVYPDPWDNPPGLNP